MAAATAGVVDLAAVISGSLKFFEMFMGKIDYNKLEFTYTHAHTQYKPSWGEGSVEGSSAHHPSGMNETVLWILAPPTRTPSVLLFHTLCTLLLRIVNY